MTLKDLITQEALSSDQTVSNISLPTTKNGDTYLDMREAKGILVDSLLEYMQGKIKQWQYKCHLLSNVVFWLSVLSCHSSELQGVVILWESGIHFGDQGSWRSHASGGLWTVFCDPWSKIVYKVFNKIKQKTTEIIYHWHGLENFV